MASVQRDIWTAAIIITTTTTIMMKGRLTARVKSFFTIATELAAQSVCPVEENVSRDGLTVD